MSPCYNLQQFAWSFCSGLESVELGDLLKLLSDIGSKHDTFLEESAHGRFFLITTVHANVGVSNNQEGEREN